MNRYINFLMEINYKGCRIFLMLCQSRRRTAGVPSGKFECDGADKCRIDATVQQ